jgi:ribosomal protein L37AE/L43A
MMLQCPDCGRKFNEQAFEKHTRICKKVFVEKRKVFNSAEHRAPEDAPPKRALARGNTTKRIAKVQYDGPGTPSGRQGQTGGFGGGGAGGGATPKWKADSSALRQAMKAARQVSLAQKKSLETGIPLTQLLPAPTAASAAADPIYDTYVQCPTCGRKYNQTAGARHIPQCKNIMNKPSRLKAHSGAPATTSRRNY